MNNILQENSFDLIIPNLWLGDRHAAENEHFLKTSHIKYVVNISDGIRSPFNFIQYYHIPIKDKKMCSSELEDIMMSYIGNAMKFIFNGLCSGNGVLVHCRKGHHRSANIVLLFLMKYLGVSYLDGSIYINNIRPYSLKRNTCVNKWILTYYKKQIL